MQPTERRVEGPGAWWEMQLAFIASCHPKRGFCPGLGTLWGCRSRCPNQPPCWPRAAPSRRACPTDSPGFGFLQLPGPSAPSPAPPTRPWNQPWGPPLTLPHLLPGPARGFPAGTLSAPQTLTRLSTLCRRPAPVLRPQKWVERGGQTWAEGRALPQGKANGTLSREETRARKPGEGRGRTCGRSASGLGEAPPGTPGPTGRPNSSPAAPQTGQVSSLFLPEATSVWLPEAASSFFLVLASSAELPSCSDT